MRYHENQYCVEPKKKFIRRKDENVLNNVVSLRISDREKRELENITKYSSKNVSEIVREAIEFWIASRKRCLDS